MEITVASASIGAGLVSSHSSGPASSVRLNGLFQFRGLSPSAEEWGRLDAARDRTLFQTRAWIDFVARTQNARPVLLALFAGDAHVGWFTGLIVRKGPFRILGSPFRGWTTPYMGFNLFDGIDRGAAARALRDYAFKGLGCVHLELADRHLSRAAAEQAELRFNVARTYVLDLRKSEDELLAAMHHSPRRYIRKATLERHVIIEEAEPAGFAEEYFSQLKDIYARHSLATTYSLERVRILIQCLFPTGALLLLRARNQAGRSVATGIFPAFNGVMHFWGGADVREFQRLHANEPIQWHAIRYWKRRGMTWYDTGGGEDYKEKYGAHLHERPWVSESRKRLFCHLRNGAQQVHRLLQLMWGLRAKHALTGKGPRTSSGPWPELPAAPSGRNPWEES